MAGFRMLVDLHAFEGVDMVCDYRISGTEYPDGDLSFDTVEVLGRGEGLSHDGWRTIKKDHPLFGSVSRWLDTQDAIDTARNEIRAAMEDEPQRPSYVIYRHAAE
jgi:hypothetical protein